MTLQDSPRYLSGEYDYEVVGGDTIYYHNHPDVSSTNNLGSVTSGNFLARAVPSWVVSAGTSYIAQRERAGTTDPSLVEPADGAGSFYNAATRTFEMVTPSEAEDFVVDVRDYGAIGDGVTDDTAAIQAAIDAASDAGGGEVYFPLGTYYGGTVTAAGGNPFIWEVGADNIHLNFEPGATLHSDQSAILIFAAGWNKPAGATSHATYWWGDATTNTYYDINDIAKGDKAITLDTAGDADNFAVGDYIYIRTGQCIATGTTEPDAEINQIVAIDSGVLSLRWPTAKSYEQEYFISGTSGYTSTSVTANAAVFGIANISDRIITNFRITNLTMVNEWFSTALRTNAALGVTITGLRGSGGNIVDNIETRATRFSNWRVESNPSSTGLYRWTIGYGTGCTDGIVDDVRSVGTGERMNVFHVHEGTAQLTIKNSYISSPQGNNDANAIEMRSRTYDIEIENTDVESESTTQPAVYVSDKCSGSRGYINNVRIVQPGLAGLKIDASPHYWTVGGTEGVFPVTAFGATGDGSTDDTAAIQAAMDAAEAVGGGSEVYFPAGSYSVTGAITIPATVNVCGPGIPSTAHTVPTVASAAGAITIAATAVVNISGTETITSITASYVGRIVTLVATGAWTLTDGSNLKLAGNFTPAAGDTITLVSDGTNWIEIARADTT